jgi:hypothetical protein
MTDDPTPVVVSAVEVCSTPWHIVQLSELVFAGTAQVNEFPPWQYVASQVPSVGVLVCAKLAPLL